jgi:hypothetical protein
MFFKGLQAKVRQGASRLPVLGNGLELCTAELKDLDGHGVASGAVFFGPALRVTIESVLDVRRKAGEARPGRLVLAVSGIANHEVLR